jgi:magnesium-protoporphyrin IX monomethyl ester (oxidative) cyclase
LIQPAAMLGESYADSAQPFLPLGLASLAAILREAGHEVRLLDAYTEGWERRGLLADGVIEIGLPEEDVASQIRRFQPQVVGFGVTFGAQLQRLTSLAGWVKAIHPEIYVICGGNFPTASPSEILDIPSVDAVSLGEGEVSFLRAIQSLENGQGLQECSGIAYRSPGGAPIINPPAGRNLELDLLPLPAYDLLPMKKYFRILGERLVPLIASRGCDGSCAVCSSREIFGARSRHYSAERLIQQIEHLAESYGVRDFALYDHNFLSDSDQSTRILDRLIERNQRIRWIAHCCLSGEGFDGEFFAKVRRAGGMELQFDIGSGSRRVLRQILKRGLDLHRIEEIVLQALANDVRVSARFMLGLPGESVEEIYETLNFAWKLRSRGVEGFEFEIAQPYVGTELRDQAVASGCQVPERDAALNPYSGAWQLGEAAAAAQVQAIRDTAQREFSSRGLVVDWTRRMGENLRLPKKVEERYFPSVAPQPRMRPVRQAPLRNRRALVESH